MTLINSLPLTPHPALWWAGCAFATLAVVYSAVAWIALLARRRSSTRSKKGQARPVTLLKPLCGLEPNLYDCLRSFCVQRYTVVQLVFGVTDPMDPAAAVVRRLQHEFPALDIALVVDGTRHGSNPKVSNLLNMIRVARHEWLVLADSDISVEPDYLERVVAPLADEKVGIVTCAYTGRAARGFWSNLGAEFIRGWFTPSVYVSNFIGSRAFGFGATIALRRGVLDAIGGFRAIVNRLADDYCLGEAVRTLGLKTVLSDVIVETMVNEPNFRALALHQLRWLRTIRFVRPVGYVLAIVTFSLPLAMLGCLLSGFDYRLAGALLLVAALRSSISVSLTKTSAARELLRLPLIPISDFLAFGLWCIGFLGDRVVWRSASYSVNDDGLAYPLAYPRQNLDTITQPSRTLT